MRPLPSGSGLGAGLGLAVSLAAVIAHGESIRFSGKVVDGTGTALPWALVSVAGTDLAGQSNADGEFSLTGTVATGLSAPYPRSPPVPSAAHAAPAKARDADGRLTLPAAWNATFPSQAGACAIEVPDGDASAPGFPVAAAPAGKTTSTAAAYTLAVSMAHFSSGSFPQSGPSAQGLVLTLVPSPSDTAYEADAKRACLDTLNALRASIGKPKLAWSKSLEAFADQGARYDARTGQAHSHFSAYSKSAVPSDAENELPGWPLKNYKSMIGVVQAGTKMMWDEGPGGGHYDNIAGDQKEVGCGIYTTPQGAAWVIHDFK